MKIPDRSDYLIFGGVFLLANKMQIVGDKMVDGLSTKQWFLTRTLMDMPSDPPPTITRIACEMDTTRQNVAKMLEKMEREGLVTIEGNESDRRSRRVHLTDLGLRRGKQVADNSQDFLKRLFKGIGAAKLNTAGAVILKMMKNLSDMQEDIS